MNKNKLARTDRAKEKTMASIIRFLTSADIVKFAATMFVTERAIETGANVYRLVKKIRSNKAAKAEVVNSDANA